MTIINHLSAGIDAETGRLPAALSGAVKAVLAALTEQLDAENIVAADKAALCHTLVRACSLSEFVSNVCQRHTGVVQELIHSGDLQQSYQPGDVSTALARQLESVPDQQQLSRQLRLFRRREMCRIAMRDLAGLADLHETIADLSALADACIARPLSILQGWLEARHGVPLSADGEMQTLVVLGMGKLGGGELNFSSDVDLIFAFPEAGDTQAGTSAVIKSVAIEEFFTRLGRQLINVLDERTADGFVFRIDMRLRPFGDSGPLVMSFDALENYYQSHGREWERYAMIKARVVAGAAQDGEQLMALLRPFVYRRYLDFGAFEAIRDMKQAIAGEIKRKGLVGNIKLGEGGIREIEFIGQAFQLIRGGSETRLQQREILRVLQTLLQLDYLPAFVVDELTESYIFLRNAEHRLQEYADQQTHLLPVDETGQLRLAFAMGFDGWSSFQSVLVAHMQRVHNHFSQVFEAPQAEQGQATGFADVWLESIDEENALTLLAGAGYDDPPQVLALLAAVRGSARFRALSRQGRGRMNTLIPLLLGAVARFDNAVVVLKRVLDLVEAVTRRTSYLALLIENPMVLSQLVKLCSVSAWIGERLMRQPFLLDELLDPRTLYAPPIREELEQDLQQRLSQVEKDDLERQMDVLRHFKNANVLRVAAADIVNAVPLMVVSDHLTHIAEVVVNAVLQMAWHYLVQRHGYPSGIDKDAGQTGFAVIAYGKLGGIELGYGSDLDLVFLYDADADAMTDGDKPVANAVFYSRLGQRMIHIFTAVTPAGALYEVDMRLRPSGESGLLVTRVDSFGDYQRDKAWTWEHQALVRARAVAGQAEVIAAFNNIRLQVLARERDQATVQGEVRSMRERMRKELDKSGKGLFDLKQGHGGIADIEFMVQYAALAHAHRHPDLLIFTDNIRILAAMVKEGLIAAEDGEQLTEIYKAFRARIHQLTLKQAAVQVDEQTVAEQCAVVVRCWKNMMESDAGDQELHA